MKFLIRYMEWSLTEDMFYRDPYLSQYYACIIEREQGTHFLADVSTLSLIPKCMFHEILFHLDVVIKVV